MNYKDMTDEELSHLAEHKYHWQHASVAEAMRFTDELATRFKAKREDSEQFNVGLKAASDEIASLRSELAKWKKENPRCQEELEDGSCCNFELQDNGDEWSCPACKMRDTISTLTRQLSDAQKENQIECSECNGSGTTLSDFSDAGSRHTCGLCNGTGKMPIGALVADLTSQLEEAQKENERLKSERETLAIEWREQKEMIESLKKRLESREIIETSRSVIHISESER